MDPKRAEIDGKPEPFSVAENFQLNFFEVADFDRETAKSLSKSSRE
jgi:hypothetical protein